MMNKVVYLIGTGATMAEMEHQGLESRLSMTEIDEAVYEMSKSDGGKYKELHDNFALPVGMDIEVMITLLEGCTLSESAKKLTMERVSAACLESDLLHVYTITGLFFRWLCTDN